ncbi:MAG: hypothetical protein R2698_13790 [Microthrixaceae bacterium]
MNTLSRPLRGGWLVRGVAAAAAVMLAGVVALEGSRAALSATTDNGSNTFGAGTVVLSDNDSGSAMFTLTTMQPGSPEVRCIKVSYTGSLTADVKLYGAVTAGTGLESYLDLTVETGSGTGATGVGGSCTGFSSPSTVYSTDTLANFVSTHSNWATGNGTNFTGATNPTDVYYRFTIDLQSNNAAQGKTATAAFTWEAQNV